MAKRRESVRTAWARATRITRSSANLRRAAVASAAGALRADVSHESRSSGSRELRPMGPYETSYDVQLGYSGRDVV